MTYDLHLGDCLEIMQSIPDQSVDLVLCDLPYGTTTCAWDSVIPFAPLWEAYARVAKPNAAIVLTASQPFTSALIMSKVEWLKDHLIWDKNKCGSPGLAKIRHMRTHEDIVVFGRGRITYNPQMQEGEPYKRKSKNPEGYVGRKNDHGYGLRPRTEFENHGTRYPKSVIRISRDFSAQQQVHPTQKPVALMEYLIKTYSNEGDTVLDNTMGSGTTGVACATTGRRFIGIERDPAYFEIARARIEHEFQKFLGDLA